LDHASGILHGHIPAAKIDHLPAERSMHRIQRSLLQVFVGHTSVNCRSYHAGFGVSKSAPAQPKVPSSDRPEVNDKVVFSDKSGRYRRYGGLGDSAASP